MMWPECALLGTVNSSPARVWRRCETGELRTIRPPGVRGNAIVDPAPRPLPAISSVSTCGLVVVRLFATGFGGAAGLTPPLTPPCEVPPGFAACTSGTHQPSAHASAARSTACPTPDRLWTAVLATTIPSTLGSI